MTFINSVKEGDRYDLIHLSEGLAVLFNAKPIGFVEGDDLARAYLGIWLSPTAPVNKHFRDHLLGKK